MFNKSLLDRIDRYRFENRIAARGEAVRRLLSERLNAEQTKKGEAPA